jgi:hypothetical protein
VAVSPAGQVNVSYFDRRNDPANFYIDEYLSRSGDGGKTFADTRLSHDMFDAAVNAPISTSGEFFGDYQGLVADRCQALAFYQDTHLANDPSRDPSFDQGAPRSRYQEVFAYRAEVAGQGSNPACASPPKQDQGAPFVNSQGKRCTPSRPVSSIDRRSIRVRGRRFQMSGTSRDLACRGKKARGKVKRVEVAVAKKTGRRCRFFRGRGRFTAKRSCFRPVFLRARLLKPKAGVARWAFTGGHGFGPALYSLRARGVDSDGNVESRFRSLNHRVVRIRALKPRKR